MTPLRPFNEEDQLRRAASRAGLHFHIAVSRFGGCGRLTEHAGHKSETRDATEPELQMWDALVGPIEGILPADIREFESRFWGPGPYYICPEDAAVLRQSSDFSPALEVTGQIGAYREAPIYVSPAIPRGYFINMQRVVPELTTAPELDDALRWELEAHLEPLMM